MSDNPLYSSFMMLTEHLYDIFVQYITDGRTRAPPETELGEMLPTFQFGAKTDRRALQSKFKSWAKRMKYENGNLVLINSGKIIIPKEKCDGLIMDLHSQDHCTMEKIISEIRMTYSWTRKNFGMDRDVVVESIFRNCKIADCHKKIRLEIARLSGSFCSSLFNFQQPESVFEIPSPAQCISPYPYRYPFPYISGPMFTPNGLPLQFSLKNGFCDTEKAVTDCNKSMKIFMPSQQYLPNLKKDEEGVAKTRNGDPSFNIEPLKSNLKLESSPILAFKRPKNASDYEALIEAARLKPNNFPNILRSEKTQFLSNFGIAPKSVCSSRTLKKFRQELRKKNLISAECMIYRERKMLRDKNKLKKSSHEKKKHCYLGISVKKDASLGKSFREKKDKIQYLKVPSKFNRGIASEFPQRKRSKTNHQWKKEPIEIIDIATSDDEMNESSELSPRKENLEAGALRNSIISNQNETQLDIKLETQESLHFEQNNTQHPDRKTPDDIHEKENIGKIKLSNVVTCQEKLNLDKRNSFEGCENYLNKKRVLLPKTTNHQNFERKLPSSNIPSEVRRFPTPEVAKSYAANRNLPNIPPTNILFPVMNPVPVSFQQKMPAFIQTRLNFAVPNQNIAPRVVYPIQLPRNKNSRLFFIDKEQKGAYFIIPQFHGPILPQNSPRLEMSFTPNSNYSKRSNLSSSIYPLPTQIPGRTEKTKKEEQKTPIRKMCSNDEKEKIDINEEMMRISKWIYRMKSNLNPCMFKHGIEKSVQKLISQLDVGILLVREARKSLTELENSAYTRKSLSNSLK